MLKLRLLMAKTSVKKYETVIRSVCTDGRIRGMMRFYGANRTGRWSGNILQLPRNYITDLTLARDIVKSGDFELLDLMYGNVPNVLSELIRTVLIPRDGCRFIVADFSAIEARVLSWLAGEQWRIDIFKNGGDIYCASASKMFKVPVKKHGVNGHLRQKGKISELACGYGDGVGALISILTLRNISKAQKISLLSLTQKSIMTAGISDFRIYVSVRVNQVEERMIILAWYSRKEQRTATIITSTIILLGKTLFSIRGYTAVFL